MICRVICEEFERRGITVEMLIIFGSLVWDTARDDSDVDFLVVNESTINWQEKREIRHSLSNCSF
jgi:predicted nucleotidyltransferase